MNANSISASAFHSPGTTRQMVGGRCKVPLAHAIGGLPLHFDALTVLWVLGDDADGLDAMTTPSADGCRTAGPCLRTYAALMAMRSPGRMERTSACSFWLGLLISQMPSSRKRALWSSGVTEAGSDEPGCARGWLLICSDMLLPLSFCALSCKPALRRATIAPRV